MKQALRFGHDEQFEQFSELQRFRGCRDREGHCRCENPFKAFLFNPDLIWCFVSMTVGDLVSSPTISTTERIDPALLSREIGRQMRDEVREAFRGVFADTGMRFA